MGQTVSPSEPLDSKTYSAFHRDEFLPFVHLGLRPARDLMVFVTPMNFRAEYEKFERTVYHQSVSKSMRTRRNSCGSHSRFEAEHSAPSCHQHGSENLEKSALLSWLELRGFRAPDSRNFLEMFWKENARILPIFKRTRLVLGFAADPWSQGFGHHPSTESPWRQ